MTVQQMESENNQNVKVVIRCRPLMEKEVQDGYETIVKMDSTLGQVTVTNPNPKPGIEPKRSFTFDAVFDPQSKQVDVYNSVARPIVDSCIEGYNGTIFAYGQTGTGKTFTMEGVRDVPELRGIIPNSFAHIFGFIAGAETSTRFLVRASYMEIYMEEIRDLLSKTSKKKLDLRENPDVGVYVKDLSTFVVKSADEIERIMTIGNKNRAVGSTNMNERSSRSHAIFTVTIERCELGVDEKDHIRVGKLNLVDLAGSERQAKTGATGDRLKEATKINLSLSTLGNVISALVDGKSTHVPYRDSKLTRLLQDSLGGNSKTVMIANIGPASYNYDEGFNTLRYANRAKNIKNKPRINEDPKDALLREFQNEIARLKKQLEDGGGSDYGSDGEGDEDGGQGSGRRKRSGSKAKKTILKDTTDEKILEMQKQIDKEKRQIAEDANLAAEEKDKIQMELEEREMALDKARQEREEMNAKLKNIEEKLLVGGVNLLHKAEEQQKMLEKASKQLDARKKKEEKLKRELTKKQEKNLEIQEGYASLKEEVEAKTEKLKKWWAQYVEAKAEINDMQTEFQREREELLENIRQLSIEAQLKLLIIDSYIPPEYLEMIESCAYWNEEIGEWQLNYIAHAGNNLQRIKIAEETAAEKAKKEASLDLNNVYMSYDQFMEGKSYSGSSESKSKKSSRPKSSRSGRPSSRRRSSQSELTIERRESSSALKGANGDGDEPQFPSARNLTKSKKHFA
eukprot:Nk52_evm77s223 gene=Nk52_evmTU77s223